MIPDQERSHPNFYIDVSDFLKVTLDSLRPHASQLGSREMSVHQLNLLLWLNFIVKVLASDVFVAYVSVQYSLQGFHAPQLFRAHAGEPQWLTVPVVSTGTV